MSELIKVSAALRAMSDEKLQSLISQRMINSNQLLDFFDLAEALTKPTAVSATIAGLPLSQARELRALAAGATANSQIATDLAEQMLISPEPEFTPYESTLNALLEFSKINLPGLHAVLDDNEEIENAPNQDQIDRDCGVEIFETLQAITELIFDLEHRYVREVGRKNVGLPDLKRLATHLHKTTDYAKQIYEISSLSGIITLVEGRWQLGLGAESWLSWQPGERFNHLAIRWREILGDASARELQESLKKLSGAVSLDFQLKHTYPFADGSTTSKISKVANLASLIGLASAGWMSGWARSVLACDYKQATELAVAKLPSPQRKLICQADLSLIAPGPLPTDIEIVIRRFADTEQIGMASTYRLSALSISHGLETGLTVEQIRELLLEMSGKDLPQPIEYLLKESESRFGRLTISGGDQEERTFLKSKDKVLLAEILNETKLKPFGLTAISDGSLTCRFEPEVLYFGLRELGFVAVRVDKKGSVISPLTVTPQKTSSVQINPLLADIQRLRQQEEKLGSSPDDDDLHRQIQLAIKNKARATFTVTSSSGAEVEFLLEPIGIANGRLRAKDRKADIERTLPITSIIKVTLD